MKINKDALNKPSPDIAVSHPGKTEDAPIILKGDQKEEVNMGAKKMTLNKAHAATILSTTPNALIKEAKSFNSEKSAVAHRAEEVEASRKKLNKYVYVRDNEVMFVSPDKVINKAHDTGIMGRGEHEGH